MGNKNSTKTEPAALSETMVVRVSKDTKNKYKVIAKERSQPNKKPVGLADVAREALVDFVSKDRELAAK